jgi:Flp pilus assembly protein TadG
VRFFKRLFRDQSGGSAIVISAALIPAIAAVGSAVDGGYAVVVRNQLGAAVDSAALAGGRAYFESNRDTQIRNFFDSNFNLANAGVNVTAFNITEPGRNGNGNGNGNGNNGNGNSRNNDDDDDDDEGRDSETLFRLKVDASATVPTMFMRVFGYTTIPVSATATAVREQAPLELVLALDNTGSMQLSAGAQTRIAALKQATRDLLSSLYGNDPNNNGGGPPNANLRVGILPYTSMVNVGGLLVAEGNDRGVNYLDMPAGYTFNPRDPLQWKGCMDADQTDNTITAATNASVAGNFINALDTQDYEPGRAGKPRLTPFHYPSIGIGHMTGGWSDPGEDCSTWTTRTRTDNGWWNERWLEGELVSRTWVPPRTYTETCQVRPPRSGPGTWHWSYDYRYRVPAIYPKPSRWPTPQNDWPAARPYPDGNGEIVGGWRSPNIYCPSEALLPASRTFGQLNSYINTELRAYDTSWGTYSNVALQWAIRMVSPGAPFGGSGPDSLMQKAIVLMTDGFIYAEPWLYARSSYGFPDEQRLVNNPSPSHEQMNDALAKRLERLCIEARTAGIAVYTVTFALPGADPRKALYRQCATTPAMYFDAVDAQALQTAFRTIGSDLSALRLEE